MNFQPCSSPRGNRRQPFPEPNILPLSGRISPTHLFIANTFPLQLPTAMGEEQARISRRGQTRGGIHHSDFKVLFLRQLLGQDGDHVFLLSPRIPNGNELRTLYPIFQGEMNPLSMKDPLVPMHEFPNNFQNIFLIKRL